MNRNTIIAASVGAVIALAVVYALNSSAFALTSLDAATADTTVLTALPRATPTTATSVRVAAAPAVAVSHNMIPAGQLVAVKIGTHVSTRDAKVGDPVEAVTTEAISVNGKVVIPSGTRVTGTVTEVKSAAVTKAAAVLRVNFTRIGAYRTQLALVSPDLAARARLANHAVDGALVAGGAVAGGVIGNQTSSNRGTEVGAVAGAVVGGVAAANIGANVQLKLDEAGKLRFEQDLVID